MSTGVLALILVLLGSLTLVAVSWFKHPAIKLQAPERLTLPGWYARGVERARTIAAARWPYALGGGHDPSHPFAASKDWRALRANIIGYDCSGAVGAVLHAMGLLDVELGTHELEHWGLPGRGEWMTLWVANRWLNGRPVEHCVIEFHKGVPSGERFFMAHFTGGPPAGFSAFFDTSGYTARRRKP